MGSRTPLLAWAAVLSLAALAPALRAEPGEVAPGRCLVMFKAPVAERLDAALEAGGPLQAACGDPSLDAVFARFGVTGMDRLFEDVDLAIKNRGGLTVRQAFEAFQAKIKAKFPLRAARAPEGMAPVDTFAIYVVRFPALQPVDAVCRALEATGHVVYAEPDRVRRLFYTPSDLTSTLWGIIRIDCQTAWDTARGNNVVVGVVDTGIDRSHPDLSPRIWTNPGEIAGNNIDDDSNGRIDDTWGWDYVNNDNNPLDDHYHGTHCAGTIAAQANNGGVVGVAFLARLMGLKGLSATGSGSDTALNNCLNYGINNGADVLSNSWGGYGYSSTYAATVANAVQNGVVPVFAAGNDNQSGTMHGPSNTAYSFSVAASTQIDGRATFSCWGIKIDVTAPGVSIYSTRPGGGYQYLQGTSMATPHVSGACAVLISDLVARSQSFSVEQVRQILRTAADDMEAPGFDRREGYGRLNVANMMGVNPADVCEAKISFPDASGPVTGNSLAVQGHARGPNFSSYVLEIGPGTNRDGDPWTTVFSSTTPTGTNGGTLHNWDISNLPDGRYTLRLTARNAGNVPFRDRVEFVRDTYSDDTASSAVEILGNPLTYFVTVDRNLGSNDADWLVMTCVGGVAYEFRTYRLLGDTDTVIDLYQSNGTTLIASNDDYPSAGDKESRIAWTCPSSGTYTLKLYGWGTTPSPGSFRLEATGMFKDGFEPDNASTQAKALSPSGAVSHHSIVPAGDVDWMSLAAVAGRTYTLEVSLASAGGAMNLDLYQPDGSTLVSTGTAGADNRTRIAGWTCPASGTYLVRVSAGSAQTGHYVARAYEKQDVLWAEDFQTVGADHWSSSGGSWSVSGGALVDTSNADTPHFAYGGLTTWTDGILDAKVRFQNPTSSGTANSGLILRWKDANSYVACRIRQDNRVEILQFENGNGAVIAGVNRTFSAGVTYPLRVTFEGTHLVFEVDGTVLQAWVADRFLAGPIALRSYGSQGVFDDLTLWRPGPGTLQDFVLDNGPFPPGMVGAPYAKSLSASGGTTPYSFAHLAGPLPPGITVGSDGLMSGTPTSANTFNFSVKATDAADRLRARTVSLTFVPATTGDTTPPTVVFVSPAAGVEFPLNNQTLQVDVTDVSAVKTVDFRVNGGAWTPMQYMGSDRYQAPLFLFEGANNIDVRAEDYASNVGVDWITVYLDSTPPVLHVDSPSDGALVLTPTVTLAGTAEDADSVTVNGQPVDSFDAVAGTWSTVLTLAYGSGTYTVAATDSYARTSTVQHTLVHRLMGDVDGDGDVDANDAWLAVQFEAGTVTPTDIQKIVADPDGNGKVDINDVYAIRRVASGEQSFN